MLKKIVPPIYRMRMGTIKHNLLRLFKDKVNLEKNEKVILVVASPHKVGSTWVYKILRELTGFHDIFPPYRMFKEHRKVRIPLKTLSKYFNDLKKGKGYLFKSHSMPPDEIINDVYYITVIRDPRDLIVSMANYVSNLPVELGGWGEDFKIKSNRDKILEVIERSDFIYELYYAWSKYDNCVMLKYEELKVDIHSAIHQILNFSGLEISEEKISKAIESNDFRRVSGRKSGKENKKSFYRKGIVGDWRNHFDEEMLNKLYSKDDGKWLRLIKIHGYE